MLVYDERKRISLNDLMVLLFKFFIYTLNSFLKKLNFNISKN
jgi:hypothetical protein